MSPNNIVYFVVVVVTFSFSPRCLPFFILPVEIKKTQKYKKVEDPLREVYSEKSSNGKKDNSSKARRGSANADGGAGDDGPPPGQSMGLQHSRHEGRVVGATWSSDPDDCHFCKGEVRALFVRKSYANLFIERRMNG